MVEFLLSKRHRTADALAGGVVWMVALGVTGVFAWMMGDLLCRGLSQVSGSFLFESPSDLGRSGGIGPILVSTLLILGVCLSVSLPLGLGTAMLLAEFRSDQRLLGQWVGWSLDVLAGVPSIVFGLFGNVFFCQVLGMGFSILSGGLTLACMVLPIFIRSTEAGFRSVPDELRQGAAALGLSRTVTLVKVLLPVALPGVLVGLVLGIGRALAETAALLFTSGYVDRMPHSLWDSGRSLSIHIYDLAMNVNGGDPRAYASALVLVVMLLVINLIASFLATRFLQQGVMSL